MTEAGDAVARANHAPSDLQQVAGDATVTVGGRVVSSCKSELTIADGLSAATFRSANTSQLKPGDLALLRVGPVHGTLRDVLELIEVHPCDEPKSVGEFSRLALSGRAAILQARSRARTVIRAYFEEQEFIEVETPTFVPSPGLDPHVHSLAPVTRGNRTDHLITSPEFHMKRLLTGGLPRIYQFARCFRAEELGRNHEPEFTLLEWYRAFSCYGAMLEDTEVIVRRVFDALSADGTYSAPGESRGTVAEPFLRFTVREAFQRFADVSDAVALAAQNEDHYFQTLVDQVEPALARLGVPAFLTHYPLTQAALARPCPDDETVAERFELYVGETELSNGFGELTCANTQRARFEREQARRRLAGEPDYPLDEKLLDALQEGLPPSAGNALGLDRLIQLATGTSCIAHTLAFSDSER